MLLFALGMTQTLHEPWLESLLTLEFQTFKEVPVIGEGGEESLFDGTKQPQKKVSSKAARSISSCDTQIGSDKSASVE